MGIIRMGPPEDIVTFLKVRFKIKTFIETGTFHGGTTRWAAQRFGQVYSIEKSHILYTQTNNKLASIRNITCLEGDSREHLRKLAPTLNESAIFWLDAHLCGGDSYGANDECPLLQEIETIDTQTGNAHALLIDDARYFMAPPPQPHKIAQWPDLSSVFEVLCRARPRYITIIEDVIIAVPLEWKSAFSKFLHERVS